MTTQTTSPKKPCLKCRGTGFIVIRGGTSVTRQCPKCKGSGAR